jgi:hypothetical protein
MYKARDKARVKKDHVLRGLYCRLKKAGKHSSVALTVVMRKALIYMNSKLKELRTQQGQNSAFYA